MGTWRILNKVETQTIADEAKWTIPSDGLSEWTQYELSIHIDGGGNHPASIIHADSAAQESGYHIPAGGVVTVGPVNIEDYPCNKSIARRNRSVYVSYAVVPREGGD
jgi:hypothetical protein